MSQDGGLRPAVFFSALPCHDAPMEVTMLEADADRAAARGDILKAVSLLEEVVERTPGVIDPWLKLAALRRAAGRTMSALAAVDHALTIEPLHFMALLSRARLIETQGKEDEAARAYLRALAQRSDAEPVPVPLQATVAHAQKVSERYLTEQARQRTAVVDQVEGIALEERRRIDRFNTNVLRQTRPYHSEPTHYHYPGLVEREFHDRAAFPWLTRLEAAVDDIRDEYLALIGHTDARAEPYIQYEASLPTRQWTALNHSLDWTAFHLIQNGRVIEENAARCPSTMHVLRHVDQPSVGGRGPNAMFSVLKPRTRIPPHTGVANTRLVCHLPLIVPPSCWFRVGADRREWTEGEAFVFDDTIEHEAANDGDHVRIVLIVDCWHPGLSPAERRAVTALMEYEESADGAPL